MRRSAVALLLLLAGCSVPTLACTDIGSSSGISVTVAEAARTAETTYPNGPQCGAGGNQAQIGIDRNGIR